MKFNKLFIFGFAFMGLLASCEDAYDIRQDGEVNDPDLVFNTVEDLQRGLNNVYGAFSTESTIEFTSVFTDEVSIGVQNGGQGIIDGLYVHTLTSGSDTPVSIWQSNYGLINFANRVIVASERVKTAVDEFGASLDPTSEDYQEQLDNYNDQLGRYQGIMGQLYAIRAFAHFQLISWFSTDPADDSALGVMLLDFVPDDSYNTFLPRSTNGALYTFINEDLDTAEEFIGLTGTIIGGDPNIASLNFINATRARMALFRKNYADAVTYSTRVLNATGGAAILTNSASAYYGEISDQTSTESVFKLSRVIGDFRIGSYWNSVRSEINGSPFYEVGRNLFDSYDVTTDVRNDANVIGADKFGTLVDNTSVISPNPDGEADIVNADILVVNRYPGNSVQNDQLLNDIKVFTVGEMILIRAEALAFQGNIEGSSTSSAAYWMRALRRRRFANNAYATPTYGNDLNRFLTDLLLERRRELSFLGHRYLDIKRLGEVTGITFDRYSRECEQYNACSIPVTDHRFTMPIPNTEITANPEIRNQQNPGY